MDSVTLTFDAKTLDYIANVLGQRPYAEVAAVLNTIATQVQQQRGDFATTGAALAGANGSGATGVAPAQ